MTSLGVWLALFGTLWSPPSQSTWPSDGYDPAPRSEVAYSFDCGSISASIRYRYERIEDAVDPAPDHRFTLLDLQVNRLRIGGHHFDRVAALFRRLDRLETIGSNCEPDRIDITIFGVRIGSRPASDDDADMHIWFIRLSPAGLVGLDA